MNEQNTPTAIETVRQEGYFLVTNRRFDSVELRVTMTDKDGLLTDDVEIYKLSDEDLTPERHKQLYDGRVGNYRLLDIMHPDGNQEQIRIIEPDPTQIERSRTPERTKRLLTLALYTSDIV